MQIWVLLIEVFKSVTVSDTHVTVKLKTSALKHYLLKQRIHLYIKWKYRIQNDILLIPDFK